MKELANTCRTQKLGILVIKPAMLFSGVTRKKAMQRLGCVHGWGLLFECWITNNKISKRLGRYLNQD